MEVAGTTLFCFHCSGGLTCKSWCRFGHGRTADWKVVSGQSLRVNKFEISV